MAAAPEELDIHPSPRFPEVDVSSALAKPIPSEPASARSEALQLLELSKQVDEELNHHQSILAVNGVDLKSSLVDAHGFPLADKDLVAIRSARQRIAMLHNDSKAVRQRVSQLLELAINGEPVGASLEATPTSAVPETSGASSERAPALEPFARINSVAAGSPADTAGLRAQDLVVRFSSIEKANNDGLKALARPGLVSDGVAIEVVVQRQSSTALSGQETTTLRLVPTSGWGGRGLLGCHIVPL